MSAHGRRRPPRVPGRSPEPSPPGLGRRPDPSPTGPAQLAWALLVIAAALIGGLAAAALVHASLTIAVIVSIVAGGIAVLAVFRSPARPPEPAAGELAAEDVGRYPAPLRPPVPPRPPPLSPPPLSPPPLSQQAPTAAPPTAPAPALAETDGQPRGSLPAGLPGGGPPGGNQTAVQLLPLAPPPGNAPDAPWWDSAQAAPPAPSPGAQRAPAPDLSTYLASTFIAQCPRCGAFRLDIRQAGNDWDFRCAACAYTWTWQPGTPWPPVRVMPRGRRE